MEGIAKTAEPLQSAIEQVREKFIPSVKAFSPEPVYKQLYPILQIFDIPDTETDNHIEYVYNYLIDNKIDPKNGIVNIQTELGATPSLERFIDRVYRYCKLRVEANKTMQHYTNLENEIKQMRKL